MAPSEWSRFRDLVGEAAAEQIRFRRGGRRLVVPRTAQSGGELPELLDRETMERVAYALGGASIYVPMDKASALRRKERDEAIRRARAAGDSVPAISRRYWLSERQVYRIVGGVGDADMCQPANSRRHPRPSDGCAPLF